MEKKRKQIFSVVTTSTPEPSTHSLPQHCSIAQTAEEEHKTLIHLFSRRLESSEQTQGKKKTPKRVLGHNLI